MNTQAKTIRDINFNAVINAKETINGIDFYTLPLSTSVVVRLRDGRRFVLSKAIQIQETA